MAVFYVYLDSIDDVKRFVDAASRCPCEVDVRSGRYLVNAKSVMGIFSLDLARPVQVEVLGGDAQGEAFRGSVADMVVPGP